MPLFFHHETHIGQASPARPRRPGHQKSCLPTGQEVIILTKYVIKFLEHDWKIQVLSPVFYQLPKILQQFHSWRLQVCPKKSLSKSQSKKIGLALAHQLWIRELAPELQRIRLEKARSFVIRSQYQCSYNPITLQSVSIYILFQPMKTDHWLRCLHELNQMKIKKKTKSIPIQSHGQNPGSVKFEFETIFGSLWTPNKCEV